MDQLFKVLDSLVLLYAKLRTIEIYLNLDAAHLLLRYLKLRKKKKNRKRSGTSLPALFSSWFFKKNICFSIIT